MLVYLTTERLILRRLTEADVDDLYRLNGDPEVMRYLTGGKPSPREDVRDQLVNRILPQYECASGHGRWMAIERSTGDSLGWLALDVPDDPARADEAELGYRLHRAAWGKGYATGGSRALVDKAFTDLGFPSVFALAMAVNLGSRRVMEKAGLRYVRSFFPHFDDPIPGTDQGEVEYALTRSEWAAVRR